MSSPSTLSGSADLWGVPWIPNPPRVRSRPARSGPAATNGRRTATEKPSARSSPRYEVYTPPGYEPGSSRKYPVLYLLHGVKETERQWDARAGLSDMLNRLIRSAKLRPLIVVLPWGFLTERQQRLRHFPPDAAYVEFLVKRVVPAVEVGYPIDPARRAIAGISMGGRQALAAGFSHPGMFRHVAAFSAALQDCDPLDWLKKSRAKAPRVFLRCGCHDGLLGLSEDLVTRLLGKIRCDPATPEGLDHPYHPGAPRGRGDPHAHNFNYWTIALRQYFPVLSRALGTSRG